jgi:beta-aspartyl-peptidase (threonine type)
MMKNHNNNCINYKGCFSCIIERVKNPVLLAQKVLEKSPHCLLASSGAERFAASFGVETVPGESLVSQGAKQALTHNLRVLQGGPSKTLLQSNEGLITNEIGHEDEEGRDTVGAVVRDFDGNLAAATSTGGLTGKAKGRVGDSPIIGAGLYADNQKGASLACP